MQYYSSQTLTLADIKPFLLGGLTTSVALLAMTVLFYFGKHKAIIAVCIFTIVALLVLKRIYSLK